LASAWVAQQALLLRVLADSAQGVLLSSQEALPLQVQVQPKLLLKPPPACLQAA
jgi:hypothetical protein